MHALLHTLYLYTEKSISLEAATSLYSDSINELTEELTSLNVTYHNARNYAQAVFIIPYAEKMFGENISRKIKTYLDNPLILTRAIFTALVFFIEA